MTRFFDLCSVDHPVPVDLIADLASQAVAVGARWAIIGAAARDLVVHTERYTGPTRATHDVDIALAVDGGPMFDQFKDPFEPRGAHRVRHRGVDIDVVPIGGVEESGAVTFADGHTLDVVGLAEAVLYADTVKLRPGLTVSVASIESQACLKILAWRDRNLQNSKDALDLSTILEACAEGRYEAETWKDEEALEASDFDILMAGAYRCGREGGMMFDIQRSSAVENVLRDPGKRTLLTRHMNTGIAADLLDAYSRGYAIGIS